jgi:hypothetical protein
METCSPLARNPVRASDKPILGSPHDDSPNSSETSHTRLTPQEDSEDSASDLAIDEDLGESFQMQPRGRNREKLFDEVDEEGVGDSEGSEEEEEDFRDGGNRRRASVSTTQSYQLYTPDEERDVVKKIDRRLVIFVALLYMLSFLDRSSAYPSCSFPSPHIFLTIIPRHR